MLNECGCDIKSLVFLGSGSNITTIYTGDGILLGDRTVTANNNDLTFQMGDGVFIVIGDINNIGVTSTSGVTIYEGTTNPGGSGTVWISGGELHLGDINYADLPIAVTGCFLGNGQRATPLQLYIDPTGLIACGGSGLYVDINTTNCLTGDGTVASPLSIQLDPTGLIACGASGLYVTEAFGSEVSGCIGGNGLTGNPLYVELDPTGLIECGPSGLYVNGTLGLTEVYGSGCLLGSGLQNNPLYIQLDPTGNITCGAGGLYVDGFLKQVDISGCLNGDGTVGDPLRLKLNPTGQIACGVGGLYFLGVNSGPCLEGDGVSTSPLNIKLNPTGFIGCTAEGLAYTGPTGLLHVSVQGCVEGDGTWISPLDVKLSPTGNIVCAGDGLAVQNTSVTVFTSGCVEGSGTMSSPISLTLDPTGLIDCGPSGLRFTGESFDCTDLADCDLEALGNVSGSPSTNRVLAYFSDRWLPVELMTSNCIIGNGTTSPIQLQLAPQGLLECSASGLKYVGPTGVGGSGSGAFECANLAACSIDNLGDVNSSTATVNQILIYDGSFWENSDYAPVNTSGCVTGSGLANDPVTLIISPTGQILCTGNGLALSGIEVGACLTGNGTVATPLNLQIDPTGLLTCGPNGLLISGINVGSTCLSGDGADVPLSIVVDPTGGITCGPNGLVSDGVLTSGCIVGNGLDQAVTVTLDPTGLIDCGPSGLRFTGDLSLDCAELENCTLENLGNVTGVPSTNEFLVYTGTQWDSQTLNVSGCLAGNGVDSPLTLTLAPQGLLECSPSGLKYVGPTGVGGSGSGAFECASLAACSINNLGDVTAASAISGHHLVFNGSFWVNSSLQTTGCITGDGEQNNPLDISLNPTGYITCTNSGLAYNGPEFSCSDLNSCSINSLSDVTTIGATTNQVLLWNGSTWTNTSWSPTLTAGCLTGNGVFGAPITLTISPTGYLVCAFDGLAYNGPTGGGGGSFSCTDLNACSIGNLGDVDTSGVTLDQVLVFDGVEWTPQSYAPISVQGCLAGNGTATTPLFIDLDPTGLLGCSVGGLAYTGPTGNYPVQATSCISGNGTFADPLYIDLDPTGGLFCGPNGLSAIFPQFTCSQLAGCVVSNLSDVNTAGASTGQVLTYNGSIWVPGNVASSGGGGSGCVTAYSYEVGIGPTGPIAPAAPSSNAQIQLEVYDDRINFWSNTTGWVLDKVFRPTGSGGSGCISTDPDNLLVEGTDGCVKFDVFDFCDSLANCSIGALFDVNLTGGISSTDFLGYNGLEWVPRRPQFFMTDLVEVATVQNNESIVWQDTATVDFDLDTSAGGPHYVKANAKISTDGGNMLQTGPGDSALYVPETSLVITTDGTSTGVTSGGTAGHTTNITLRHPAASNRLSINPTTGGLELNGAQLCDALGGTPASCLLDVTYSTPAIGHVLTWDGIQWTNQAVSGGGGGGGSTSSFSLFSTYVHRHDNGAGATYDIDIRDGVSSDGGNDLTLGTDARPFFQETTTQMFSIGGVIRYTDENGSNNDIDICTLIDNCALANMGDVSDVPATNNQILRWNSTFGEWQASNENVAGSYSFTISDGFNTQIINNANVLTFAESDCIDTTVSATDTVTFTPKLAPAQSIYSSSEEYSNSFDNGLRCTSQGLFVPCIDFVEATPTTGNDTFKIRVACGQGGSNWTEYNLPAYYEVKRTSSLTNNDPAAVGEDLGVNDATGEIFFHNTSNVFEQVPGTYGYAVTQFISAGGTYSLVHNFDTYNVVIQVYNSSNVQINTAGISLLTTNRAVITAPYSDTFRIVALPVYNKAQR